MWHKMQRWGDGATRQRMPGATGSWKRQGTDVLLEPPEGSWPCRHLDFSSVKQISAWFLASRTVREYTSVVLSHWCCGNLLPVILRKPVKPHSPDFIGITSLSTFVTSIFTTLSATQLLLWDLAHYQSVYW